MNNWQEWRAQTNPTLAASLLKLLAPAFTTNQTQVQVKWQSITNVRYFLQRSSALNNQSFSTIASNIVGSFGVTSFVDTNAPGADTVFYRVGVQ